MKAKCSLAWCNHWYFHTGLTNESPSIASLIRWCFGRSPAVASFKQPYLQIKEYHPCCSWVWYVTETQKNILLQMTVRDRGNFKCRWWHSWIQDWEWAALTAAQLSILAEAVWHVWASWENLKKALKGAVKNKGYDKNLDTLLCQGKTFIAGGYTSDARCGTVEWQRNISL